MPIDKRCDRCSGCPTAPERHAPTYRKDSISRDIAILVDSPTALEQAKKVLLSGDTGHLAVQVLQACGVNPADCYITSALNCRPNMKKPAMVKNAMLSCRARVIRELQGAGVSRVLCLGSVGFSQLLGADRVLPVTKVRGRWEQAYGMDLLATFNPAWLFGEADYFRDFADDVQKFCTTDPSPAPDVELWYPETLKEMWEAFEFLHDASFVASDVETGGLSVYSDELLAVGFGVLYEGTMDGCSVVLRQDILEARETWVEIEHLMSRVDQATVFHNSKFDLKFIRRELLKYLLPYNPQHIEDTMLLHYTLDERPMGRFQSHSLKNLARIRHDAPDYDIDMGKWLKEYYAETTSEARKAEMRSRMHEYLALDCYYTACLYPGLVNEVMEEDPMLMDHYQNLLMPGTHALVEIETHGAAVDRAFFEKQWAELQRRAAPVLQRIQDYTGIAEFNPNSPKQVADLFYTEVDKGGYGLPVLRTARRGKQQEGKTSKQILKLLKKRMIAGTLPDHIALIDDIMEYRNLIKNAGTYVKGLLTRMDDDDRIRCDFLPHGTSTGRLSAQNPNLQNIPEASHTGVEIRDGYVAPEGYLLFNADYSQLELRVAAHVSKDPNFTQVYVEDRDMHQEVVFALYGTTKEETTPYMRYLAKCMSFGALYCRGPQSLANGPEMDMVEDEFGGVRWTVEEAKEFFEKWFGNFPDFKRWTEEISAFGYEHQYVQTEFGNKRRFPLIPRNDNGAVNRQSINTPIQGTAALITFSAFTRIHHRFKELNAREGKTVAHLTITVHDSIMGEFMPEYLEEVQAIVVGEMENNCPIDFSVPLKADFEYAPSWGKVKDWASPDNLAAFLDGIEMEAA